MNFAHIPQEDTPDFPVKPPQTKKFPNRLSWWRVGGTFQGGPVGEIFESKIEFHHLNQRRKTWKPPRRWSYPSIWSKYLATSRSDPPTPPQNGGEVREILFFSFSEILVKKTSFGQNIHPTHEVISSWKGVIWNEQGYLNSLIIKRKRFTSNFLGFDQHVLVYVCFCCFFLLTPFVCWVCIPLKIN